MTIKNGWISRETLSLEPNRTEETGDNGESFTNHFTLPEGWYETSWFDGEMTQSAQSFISEDSNAILPPPSVDPIIGGFNIIPGGIAF